ncbi:MAG: DUF1080 domain-containing protein [Bacteroidetes bacterium]|nr:MAG: DUF1080 domain-containing protein [Bacteroidota bacterium]
MGKTGKYSVACLFVIVMTFCIFQISCSGRRSNQKPLQTSIIEKKDSGFLFDGKSLDGWEITNFGPQGPVSVSGDQIILGMGDGCTGITWKRDFPIINYEVSLDAMRVEGTDFFCGITFPVGKDPCTLIVGGWGGTTVGLSSIDGRDASENSTTTLMKFEKKRWYHIRLKVTEAEILASIDSVKVVDFKTGHNKLSIRPEVELSKPFGITSWRTTSAIRNIMVKIIEK